MNFKNFLKTRYILPTILFLFIFLLLFQNRTFVTIKILWWDVFSLPLFLLIIILFVVGFLFGMLTFSYFQKGQKKIDE